MTIASILWVILLVGIITGLFTKKGIWSILKALGSFYLVLMGIAVLGILAAVVMPQIKEGTANKNRPATIEPRPRTKDYTGTSCDLVKFYDTSGKESKSSATKALPPSVIMDDEFEPDIYPSYLSAAKGLMVKVSNKLGSDYRLRKVLFPTMGRSDHENAIRSLIPNYFPTGQTSTTQSSRPVKKIIDLSWGITDTTVRLTYNGETGGGLAYEASYADKSWVDNFSQFMASRGREKYLIARSGTACTSEAEAREQAYGDAARQLLPYVETQFKRLRFYQDVRDDELLRLIQAYLYGPVGDNLLVKDQFIQSYKRPYGTIWRTMLLIDYHPEKLQDLKRVCENEYYKGLTTTASTLVGGVVLVGVICLLYWLVNSYTKGYYTWKLRWIMVIGVLMVMVVIAYFVQRPTVNIERSTSIEQKYHTIW